MAKFKVLLVEAGTELSIFPPLGLMELGAFLRANNVEVLIKDYCGLNIDENELKNTIEKFDPFVVGVRVLTGPNILRGLAISRVAKELGRIVVWGGPHPTILPEQTLENQYIDAVVVGEGEYAFLDLLNYLDGKKNVKPLGCGIKREGKIIVLQQQKKVVDLNKTELPAWDLVENVDRYFPDKKYNALPISTTRGCPYKCGFCHNSNANVKKYLGCYRIAEPSRAVKEYKFVSSIVKNEISFLDVGEDLHLVSKEYTNKFCDTLDKSKLGLKWFTSARFHTMDLELVNRIAKSGCDRILFGVESGSPRIQKLINKPVPLEHAKKICKALMDNDILVTNAYIFGHPTETLEELKMTLRFLKEIPADQNLIQMYRPLPATPYFEICKSLNKGLLIPETLEGWADFGVLGSEKNFSEIPDKTLFKYYYKTNLFEQLKYLKNIEKYYIKRGMYKSFIRNLYRNKFTFKAREMIHNNLKR